MPVGTILAYTGNLADIPNGWHLCDGTEGTPNLLDNRFLEGDANIGIFKNPGLPNIKGSVDNNVRDTIGTDEGALSQPINSTFYLARGTGSYKYGKLEFDASLSNPIYGASTTVQPKSYTVYFIMKIK